MPLAFRGIEMHRRQYTSFGWRASSSICVYSLISPPTIERNPAITLPTMPRLRTTKPNT